MEKASEPGVSGKKRNAKAWINPDKYEAQKNFMDNVEESEKGYTVEGRGQNLHGRSDLGDQEKPPGQSVQEDQVIEALKRGPEVDIQDISVHVKGSVVYLEGLAEDTKELRAMESIAKSVPGVSEVISQVDFRSDDPSL